MSTIAQRVLALPPGVWQQIGFLLHVACTSHDVERIDRLRRNLDSWIGSSEGQPSRSTLDAILGLVPEWRVVQRRRPVQAHERLVG